MKKAIRSLSIAAAVFAVNTAQARTVSCISKDLEGFAQTANKATVVDLEATEIKVLVVPELGCGIFNRKVAEDLKRMDYAGRTSAVVFVGRPFGATVDTKSKVILAIRADEQSAHGEVTEVGEDGTVSITDLVCQ